MLNTNNTAKEFLAASRTLLEEKEAENNLILGLAATLNRDIRYYGDLPPLFISVHHHGKCVCACLQTPPRNLIIYVTKEHLDHSIREVCKYLVEKQIEIPGIIGPKYTVLRFNEVWTSLNDVSAHIQMNEMVYKLEKVNPVPISKGKMRKAIDSDLELVAGWVAEFHQEAVQPISAEEAAEMATKKIREDAFYLWETDEVVSLAGWTRPTRNGVTIAPVFTPLAHRQKGYATSCVAKLSEMLLKKYRFCALFTDLSNPTSNSIYQKMGYKPVDPVLQCEFVAG